MIDTGDIDVFLGLDVGKGEHHATAVTPAGKKAFDKRLPNTEPRLRELFAKLQAPVMSADSSTFSLTDVGSQVSEEETASAGSALPRCAVPSTGLTLSGAVASPAQETMATLNATGISNRARVGREQPARSLPGLHQLHLQGPELRRGDAHEGSGQEREVNPQLVAHVPLQRQVMRLLDVVPHLDRHEQAGSVLPRAQQRQVAR
ncbi:hypothetical protein GCM10010234_18200 [Streptomyces hawaiiensis]